MSQSMMFVMEQLFNRPLLIHHRKAEMIVAALANRLDLSSLESTGPGGRMLGRPEMAALAADGRAEVTRTTLAVANAPGASVIGQSWYGDLPYRLSASGIAIVDIWGTLTRNWGVGPYSGSTGYDGITTAILHAIDNPKVKAIWLNINSGGGAVDGCFDCQDFIFSVSKRNGGKPIWAFAADHAYSAAYALAVAADKVFVPRTGGVGSVGCVMVYVDISKALTEAGIEATIIRAGSLKAKGIGALEPIDGQMLAHWQQQCDETREMFIESVAACMRVSKTAVSATEGLDYMGSRAKAIGFVTDVLSEQEAWAKLERSVARN